MNIEKPTEIPQLDSERVRGFISECARLYGPTRVRILKARGWQEADAWDIVQHAFMGMIKKDGEAYPDSFVKTVIETDYDPQHYRSRGFVIAVIRYNEISAHRKKGAFRFSKDEPNDAIENPPSPATMNTHDAEDSRRSVTAAEERYLAKHNLYWLETFFLTHDRDDIVLNLSKRAEERLIKEIGYWFEVACRRFEYSQHWQVYILDMVEGKPRDDIAAEMNIAVKTVSNKAYECRLLCGGLGRLLMALERVSRTKEPTNAEKFQAMLQCVKTLLVLQDELLADQLKVVFIELFRGELNAEIGKNNRYSLKYGDMSQDEALRDSEPDRTHARVSRATLILAGMVLNLILHVTCHYNGAHAHGDE